MLKIFNKFLIRIEAVNLRGFSKNPLFFFGLISVLIFFGLYASCGNSADAGSQAGNRVGFFSSFPDKPDSKKILSLSGNNLFSSKASAIPLETPDLKIIQDNTLGGVSAPQVVSGKVLGDVFGGNQNQKEVVDYIVQPGDTLQSIADAYKVSVNTVAWANGLTSSSAVKVGQDLIILPIDGVLYIVKLGDTISGIAQKYKAQPEDIISFNDLANQDDIYASDILIIPGGVMPKKASPVIDNGIPVPNNFFIFPTEGIIWQGIHYYHAVDIANDCGTPIRAAAAGTVRTAVGNGQYNQGMGNHITISHSNGTSTYYGHLMTLLVKSGDKVYTGQQIGLMGGRPGMAGAGHSTGCHVHFQVTGATNWLTVYPYHVKSVLKY